MYGVYGTHVFFCYATDFTIVNGQVLALTCNYSTPYTIPESSPTEYYLYDGINFTVYSSFERVANVSLINVEIFRTQALSGTVPFRGFYVAGTPVVCLAAWLNRCTYTFDQDSSCDPCEFSVTVSGYDSSTDDTEYRCVVQTTNGTVSTSVVLAGKTNA